MGYREYAKDYEVHYETVEGRRRKKTVRTYVGPWFRFRAAPDRIARLRRLYLAGLVLLLILVLIPLLVDCAFTRTWYVQLPGVLRTIPLFFAFSALWRLWTAGEQVDREHSDCLGPRMNSACFFLAGFSVVSLVGCGAALFQVPAAAADYLICLVQILSFVISLALFLARKGLEMEPVPRNPADSNP